MSRTRLILLVLVSLILGYAVLLASGIGPRSSDAALKARAALTSAPPTTDGNAFAEFWFAGRDIPMANMAKLLEEDRQRIEAARNQGESLRTIPLHAYSDQFPQLRPLDPETSCTPGEVECIAKARAHRLLLAAELRPRGVALEKARRLLEARDVRAPGPDLMAESLNDWPGANVLLNDIALRFVDGATDTAQADLCRHIAAWRRLGTHTTHLQVTRLALPVLNDAVALFAEMRAELPADAPMSPECEAALSPLSQNEFRLCPAMQGELRLAQDLLNVQMDAAARSGQDRTGGLVQDLVNLGTQSDPTLNLLALKFWQSSCTSEPVPTEVVACGSSERLLNPVGCGLVEQLPLRAEPLRPLLADLDRRLRIVSLAVRWETYADEAARADAIRSLLGAANPPPSQLVLDPDRRTISIELLDPEAEGPFSVFLPGTYFQPAGTSRPQ